MAHPKRLYELLLDYCDSNARIEQLTIGLVWTVCQTEGNAIGMAMSPGIPTRTLPWPGSLSGKTVGELGKWILSWDAYEATVAMAAINSTINGRPLPNSVALPSVDKQANLAVFDYFLPQLRGKNVVVIGRYPGIERYSEQMHLNVLEKQPVAGDLPDAACEFLLPNADWVFLTGSSIPNKTFPRLAELSAHAKTVLMGPTVPWLPQLHEFGIDYLAGVEITDPAALYRTAAEGGGVKAFENGLRYRVAELTPPASMAWIQRQIRDCVSEKARLSQDMENWYAAGRASRFPGYADLEQINVRLSRLDSSYKPLWDKHGGPIFPKLD
ncbi:MAG: Rossmann-like domain-containing protein [Methylobacter sp.]